MKYTYLLASLLFMASLEPKAQLWKQLQNKKPLHKLLKKIQLLISYFELGNLRIQALILLK